MRFRRVELAGSAEIPAYHWRYQLLAARAQAADALDLPGPRNLAAALAGSRDEDRGNVRAALDRLAASYAQAGFADLADAKGIYAPPPAKTNGAGPPIQARVIARLLALVEQAGLAEREGTAWHFAESDPTPIELWREALARFPAHWPNLQLIARCGETLTAILRPSSVSQSDTAAGQDREALEALYDADPLFHGSVDAMAAMLRRAAEGLPEARLLRVLEVAGGGSELTGPLLAALPAGQTEYVFTDTDESAVARAEVRFAGFDFIVLRRPRPRPQPRRARLRSGPARHRHRRPQRRHDIAAQRRPRRNRDVAQARRLIAIADPASRRLPRPLSRCDPRSPGSDRNRLAERAARRRLRRRDLGRRRRRLDKRRHRRAQGRRSRRGASATDPVPHMGSVGRRKYRFRRFDRTARSARSTRRGGARVQSLRAARAEPLRDRAGRPRTPIPGCCSCSPRTAQTGFISSTCAV